jgi:hypothetical protein
VLGAVHADASVTRVRCRPRCFTVVPVRTLASTAIELSSVRCTVIVANEALSSLDEVRRCTRWQGSAHQKGGAYR